MRAELVVVPVLLPLLTAGLMLWAGEGRRHVKALLNVLSTSLSLAAAVTLLVWVQSQDAVAAFGIYLPGNWPVPFGIVLVADHLSALMAVLTGTLGLATLLYALARWQHAGVHFHVLFQLQLMGLYGAFLTADLFNLFVFFEVLLAASYGLLLHGGGNARVKSGLHYIAINLMASLLFLIGVAVLYGVTGTLNMADIAQKLQAVPTSDRGLLHTGAAILAIAFLAKAGLWPLNFWLPGAYSAASAPVAGLFAILTKVGVYALLRLWTLCFPENAGASAHFGGGALIWGGLATLAFGAIGMLASQQLARLAAYSVIASSGTLIAAIGFDAPALSTGALFYLVSSTLAGGAMFMLVELMERSRQVEVGPQQIDDGRDRLPAFFDAAPPPGVNLDDNEDALIGRAIPGALAFLGVTFGICAGVVAGLPPFSGFVAKLAMLQALLQQGTRPAWALFALVIVSGLFAATALIRVGIRHFWGAANRASPKLRVIETLPIGALLAGSMMLVVWGEPALRYARDTADALHNPERYIRAVMSARPLSPQPGEAP
ncbi:MAG: monovalent cation/H+ antiporter subunit D [Burkholderiales bacterium RIFCSPHIGHO2_01_FULL_63_240]|jgi:multicomponent K+:H+ antiporter subunit D|nr:MAG: monovalent cation/H+ antiporter subunit D [Burkholderiales bacterium RIFCSPHIGHO2_01_FULL_63_240]